MYVLESQRQEGLFARTRNRSLSGDKAICYGDTEQSNAIDSAPSHVLDPMEIKSGSPLPRKTFPKTDIEPAGKKKQCRKMWSANIFPYHFFMLI